jgi:hypothetical protein
MSFEFKVGDRVEFGGLEGEIVEFTYDIKVDRHVVLGVFNGETVRFFADGRLFDYHTKSLLNLIERPKRIVKKTVESWMNIYWNGITCVYKTRAEADEEASHVHTRRTDCVKLTGEYEVEE